jgi:SAM-dependent methyltransferase
MNEKFPTDLSKQDMIHMFGYGYYENWSCYEYDAEQEIVDSCIKPFYDENHNVMEIGCGGGKWTLNYLSPNFKKIYALDVIPQILPKTANIEYIELNDKDFYCTNVEDESIDFVWSFGTFCHFSVFACEEYLSNIYKKLKPSGKGVIMFANWHRNFKYKNYWTSTDINSIHGNWYYNDEKYTIDMLSRLQFKNIKDVIPNFRDSLIYFEK